MACELDGTLKVPLTLPTLFQDLIGEQGDEYAELRPTDLRMPLEKITVVGTHYAYLRLPSYIQTEVHELKVHVHAMVDESILNSKQRKEVEAAEKAALDKKKADKKKKK